jgi:type II secretion system protein G
MKGNNKSMHVSKQPGIISGGFTLVEIIVVLGLLGIIIATVLATLNPFTQLQKSNDAHRKGDLESLQHALEMSYQDNGRYPTSTASFQIQNGSSAVAWGSSWQPYITIVPKDPIAGNTYIYYSPASSNGQTYYLYANLQRGANDPQACNKGNACASIGSAVGFPSANACGGICNYGVSSTNVSP